MIYFPFYSISSFHDNKVRAPIGSFYYKTHKSKISSCALRLKKVFYLPGFGGASSRHFWALIKKKKISELFFAVERWGRFKRAQWRNPNVHIKACVCAWESCWHRVDLILLRFYRCSKDRGESPFFTRVETESKRSSYQFISVHQRCLFLTCLTRICFFPFPLHFSQKTIFISSTKSRIGTL